MADPPAPPAHDADESNTDQSTRDQTQQELLAIVGEKEQRKLRARRRRDSVWFGLGMFGMIGWSVAVPVLICVALGIWLDRRWPGPQSWTLMLLFIGFVLGCANAWYWVVRERTLIEQTMIRSHPTQEETAPNDRSSSGAAKAETAHEKREDVLEEEENDHHG